MKNVKFNKKKAFITVPFNGGTVQIFADYCATIEGHHFFIHKKISEVKDEQAEFRDGIYTLTEFSTGIAARSGSKSKVLNEFIEVSNKPENCIKTEIAKYTVLNIDAENYIENVILAKPKTVSGKPILKNLCPNGNTDNYKDYFNMVEMFCKMSDISPKFFIEKDVDGLYYIAVRHKNGGGKMYIQECYVQIVSLIIATVCEYYKTEFSCEYSGKVIEAIELQAKAKIARKKAVKIELQPIIEPILISEPIAQPITDMPKVAAIVSMPIVKKRKFKFARVRSKESQRIRQGVNDTIAAMQALRVLFWQILHPLIHYPPKGFFTLNLATIKQNVHNKAKMLINTNLQNTILNIINGNERSNTNKFRLHWTSG